MQVASTISVKAALMVISTVDAAIQMNAIDP